MTTPDEPGPQHDGKNGPESDDAADPQVDGGGEAQADGGAGDPADGGAGAPADGDAAAPADGGAEARRAGQDDVVAPSAADVGSPSASAGRPPSSCGPDRVYRSGAGIGGGVLLLALIAWLGIDAVVRGRGDTPWKALAIMLLLVPLVLAFTLRPAVYANDDRLRIRNPFRTITLPWGSVAGLKSGYSNEAVAQSGAKYQLWAIPVSLRARKRAGRAQARAAAGESGQGGLFGRSRSGGVPGTFGGSRTDRGRVVDTGPARAQGDRSMDDLRELAEERAKAPEAQGEPEVKWCYEVMGPAAAGLVLLAVLVGAG